MISGDGEPSKHVEMVVKHRAAWRFRGYRQVRTSCVPRVTGDIVDIQGVQLGDTVAAAGNVQLAVNGSQPMHPRRLWNGRQRVHVFAAIS